MVHNFPLLHNIKEYRQGCVPNIIKHIKLIYQESDENKEDKEYIDDTLFKLQSDIRDLANDYIEYMICKND